MLLGARMNDNQENVEKTEDLSYLESQIDDSMVTINRTAEKGGPITLNRKTIFKMAAYGWSKTDICKTFGIDDNSLYRYFKNELELGSKSIPGRLKQVLLMQCLTNPKCPPAFLIFALKNYSGMSDEGLKDDLESNGTVEFRVKFPAKPDSNAT